METLKCDACGAVVEEHLIDYKPKSLAKTPATDDLLAAAADRGEDFTFPACKRCYGPAFTVRDKI